MEHAEFQVVILAGGPGSRMYPLTTELAKPLLPIANRPMISYQLELLERAGFAEAIVIAQESAASGLKNFIVDFYKGKIKIDWNFLPDFMGTAEALLRIKNKIKSDFIVISGDLIVDNRFLHNMADMHRTQDATATLLITPRVEEENAKSAKGAKVTNEFGLMDYIGFAPDGARLLYFKAAADVENRMEISKSLLINEPNITIHTDLIDSHFYIFSKHVMRLLEKRSDILSIKGELVPYLVSAQYSKSVSEEDLHIKRSQHTAYTMTTSGVDMEDNIRCFAYLMRDGYCGRANTIKSYMQMNLDISTRGACYQPSEPLNNQSFISPLAVISPQTQIAVDCVVGQGTKIGDKCSIKKSVIGKHCHIEDKVKIINSVIMNHVTISAGCVINGSIVCDNVHMKPGCTIKDSQIGVAYHVPERAEIKNETLCVETDSGWMDI